MIIDHLGRPFQGTPKEHEVVLTWSRFKNTVMKLSAIPQPESYPHRNIRPVIRRLVAEYGAKRIIYGGGFSTEGTTARVREAFQEARSFIDCHAASR